MSKEARVGLLIFILCAIMLGLAPTQRKRAPILGTLYKLSFHEIEGLSRGDSVRMGGVPAGRVVEIDFAPRSDWEHLSPGQPDVPMVLVTIALEKGFHLPTQSGYKIISNLKGQHFINIVPGAFNSFVPANSVVNDELEAEVEDTLGATLRNLRTLSRRTEDLRKQFSDPAFRRELKDGASNARFYSNEFLGLSYNATAQVNNTTNMLDSQENALIAQTNKLDSQVARGHVYMDNMIPNARRQLADYRARLAVAEKQMDSLYTEGEKFNSTIKGLADQLNGPGQLNVNRIKQQVKGIATRMDDFASLTGDIHAITSDEQVRADLKKIAKNFKGKSEDMKAMVKKYDEQVDQFKWLMKEEPEHDDEP